MSPSNALPRTLILMSVSIAFGMAVGLMMPKHQAPSSDTSVAIKPASVSKADPVSETTGLTDTEIKILEKLRSVGDERFHMNFANLRDAEFQNLINWVSELKNHESSEAAKIALEMVLTGTDSLDLWNVASQIQGPDIARTLDEILEKGYDNFNSDRLMRHLIYNLNKEKPELALGYATQVSSAETRTDLIIYSLESLAKDDPEKVLSWLRENNENAIVSHSIRNRGVVSAFREIGKVNLASATELINGIEEPALQESAARGILRGILGQDSTDLSDMLDFISGRPEDIQYKLVNISVRHESFNSVEEALTYVESIGNENPALGQLALGTLARDYSTQYPHHAADIALSIQNPAERSKNLNIVFDEWIQSDIISAGNWLSSQPKDAVFDGINQRFAIHAAPHDPIVAIDWASSIEDSSSRERTVSEIVKTWSDSDPDKAIQFVQESELLSDDIRQSLNHLITQKIQ